MLPSDIFALFLREKEREMELRKKFTFKRYIPVKELMLVP